MNTSQALSCLGPGIPPVIINVSTIIIIVSIIERDYVSQCKEHDMFGFHNEIYCYIRSSPSTGWGVKILNLHSAQRISVTVTTNTLSCFYIIIYWKYKNVNSFKSAKSHILKVVASKLPILNTPSPHPLLWLFGWLDSDKLTPCLVRGVTSVGSSDSIHRQ